MLIMVTIISLSGITPLAMRVYSLTLEEKALDFEKNLRDHHLLDDQLLAINEQGAFDEKGDSGFWTALYIAAEAYRYQVTGNTTAYTNMAKGIYALHELQAKTGVPGLLARYIENDKPYESNNTKFHHIDLYHHCRRL